MNSKITLKTLFILYGVFFAFIQFITRQERQNFLLTKGDNNISIITMGSIRSSHCTIIEYPDFLVLQEIPKIPQNSIKTDDHKANPLITFIDSIYSHKPIKYILNSHSHVHSLSTITPFLDRGAKLITTKENIKIYNKRGLFKGKLSKTYYESVIQISSDTILLSETKNPIEVLYLKKSDYKSIPTETYLFFYFSKQKLLAASCMVHLKDLNEKYGYKGVVYNNRLLDVNKIIADKDLVVENTIQMSRLRFLKGLRKLPIFPISYMKNVLKHGWHINELVNHFQNMSFEKLTTKKDSLLNFLVENEIYHTIINHAVYLSIDKKEYQKAVAIAQILILYEPGNLNEVDTLGEAFYNNGQLNMAKHYNNILKRSKGNTEGLGMVEWEKNKKNRLKNDT